MKEPKAMKISALAFACLLSFSVHAASRNGPKTGDKPPLLRATTLLQAPARAKLDAKSLHGKVVVLEFWATWCGPCVAAIPHLNQLAEKFQGRPVQFVAITDEEESVVKPFLTKRPIKAWIALDRDKAMHKAYGVGGIPHTVVLGKDGAIAAITYPTFLAEQHIKDLLAGKKVSLDDLRGTTAGQDSYEPGLAQPVFQVLIRPSAHTTSGCSQGAGRLTAQGYTVGEILPAAFDQSSVRILTNAALPADKYDFIVIQPGSAPAGPSALLQQALKSTFGLTGKKELKETDVLALKVKDASASGLVVSPTGGYSFSYGPRRIKGVGVPMSGLASALESVLKKPVFDETGLTNRYDISLEWETQPPDGPNPDDVTKLVREKLGLELVPEKRAVEWVVIEQAQKDAQLDGK